MDQNGATVSGAIHAKKARVFWTNGRLYVATSPTQVQSVEVPEPPQRKGSTYKMFTSAGIAITVNRAGCGCQKDKTLGSMTQEALIEEAQAVV